MSNFTAYNEASQFIIENWGEKGKKVLYECAKSTPFSGTLDDNMGANTFFCICYVLSLLSVKTE